MICSVFKKTFNDTYVLVKNMTHVLVDQMRFVLLTNASKNKEHSQGNKSSIKDTKNNQYAVLQNNNENFKYG